MRPSFKTRVAIAVTAVLLIVEIPIFVLCGGTRIAIVELALSVIAALLAVLFLSTIGESHHGQVFLGMPTALLGSACLAVQLIVNIVTVFVGGRAEPVAYVVSALILFVIGALIMSTQAALSHIEHVEASRQDQTAQMDRWRRLLCSLSAQCDGDAAKAISSVEDQMRFSSPISTQQTAEIDAHIERELTRLSVIVSDSPTVPQSDVLNCCNKLKRLLASRNHLARS